MSINLNNLSKSFDSKTLVLDNINLAVKNGELLVIVGPSGCGKSTLLRLLAGLDIPSSGQILFDDKDVVRQTPQQRNVAMVFQNYALYPHMTVRQNLSFPLRMQKHSAQAIGREIDNVVSLLNLENILERRPHQLSGGQKQRVAMGRALVRKPQLFLLDEPLSNLDAKLRTQIRTEIAALQKTLGITTVYVTHDQVEAMTMGDRVAVINQGKILQVDRPDRLYNSPANIFVAGFIGNPAMNFCAVFIREQGNMLAAALKDYNLIIATIDNTTPIVNFVNRQITLGFRPEDIVVTTPETGIEIQVDTIERLGYENLVYFHIVAPAAQSHNPPSFIARWHKNIAVIANTTMYITFDNQKLVFFNTEGERI